MLLSYFITKLRIKGFYCNDVAIKIDVIHFFEHTQFIISKKERP